MFESRDQPLLPLRRFLGRLAWSLAIAAAIDGIALAIGAIAFRRLEGLTWMDASLNAVLVLA